MAVVQRELLTPLVCYQLPAPDAHTFGRNIYIKWCRMWKTGAFVSLVYFPLRALCTHPLNTKGKGAVVRMCQTGLTEVAVVAVGRRMEAGNATGLHCNRTTTYCRKTN